MRDTLTGMHFDDMYTLELVCQGIQEIHLDGDWRPVPPLHVVWTSPGAMHAHRISTALETIFVVFPVEMVERVWGELYPGCELQAPNATILPCAPQLQQALYHLVQEVHSASQMPDYIISLLLQLVLANFLRTAIQPEIGAPAVVVQRSLQENVSDVMQAAIALLEQKHACPSLTLEEIAQTIGLSFYHFSRRFKHEVGITPGHYLRQQRLNHALQLLFSTTLSIEEISYRSGFGSARQFTEACKAVFQQAPSSLREARGLFFLSNTPDRIVPALPSPEHSEY